jgi:hypothetical protein
MKHPVHGKDMSGLFVPVMMKSRSSGDRPAAFNARRAACVPRSEVETFVSTILRSRIPEREIIHSSVVSTIFSRSKLVKTLGGAYDPVAIIRDLIIISFPSSGTPFPLKARIEGDALRATSSADDFFFDLLPNFD